MKAIIRGVAKATMEYYDDEDELVVEELYPNYLQQFDGFSIEGEENEFVQYADRLTFVDKLKRGYTHFEFDQDQLWSVCEYELKNPLTEEELKELAEYT